MVENPDCRVKLRQMKLAVPSAARAAFDHTWVLLIRGFRLRLWLGLAFAIYMSQHFAILTPHFWRNASVYAPINRIHREPGQFLAPESIAFFGVFIPGFFLLLWLHAKFQFVFLHSVLRGEWTFWSPWRERRKAANSLFRFQLVFIFFALLSITGIVAGATALTVYLGRGSAIPMALMLVSVLLGAQLSLLVQCIIRDFLVPIMDTHDMSIVPSIRYFFGTVLRHRVSSFIRFYILKLGFWGAFRGSTMLAGFMITSAMSLYDPGLLGRILEYPNYGFGVVAVTYPYILLGLPMFVFNRLFSLHLLTQAGEEKLGSRLLAFQQVPDPQQKASLASA